MKNIGIGIGGIGKIRTISISNQLSVIGIGFKIMTNPISVHLYSLSLLSGDFYFDLTGVLVGVF